MTDKYKIAALAITAGLALGGPASAQGNYPTKPITIILPVSPGGGTDTVVRTIAEKLTAAVGQQIIVDNRPGAGGNTAGEIVANADPDGYTILAVTAAHATNPSLYTNMKFDPFKDLTPITQLTTQPYLLVVPPSVPANNVKEFVEFAKNKDGGITYASSGAGLLGHLGMELLRTQAGFEAVHIPYKGAGPALVDTIAGRVDAFFPTIVSGGPQVAAGKVKALGVTSSKASPVMPDVPPISDQGYPEFEVNGWYGLIAPAGTPEEIISYLQTEVKKILEMPEVAERIRGDGAEPVGSTPEEFAQFIEAERQKWAEVIEVSGAKAN